MVHPCNCFGEVYKDDGSLTATFHLRFVDGLELPDPAPGRAFKIIRSDSSSTGGPVVLGGYLRIDEERAQYHDGLLPGVQATAIGVKPEFGLTSSQFCVVDLIKHAGHLVVHPQSIENPVIMDLCSGINGWTYGGRPFGFEPVINVEADHDVAEVGSRNLGHWFLTTDRVVNASYSELQMWLRKGITICDQFQNVEFWERICRRGIHIVVASLPCPPWSELARARGLTDSRGDLFRSLQFFINVFRPIVLAFENVRGLLFHADWDCICKMFYSIGFVLAHESVDALSLIMPMTRDRASVIFINHSFAASLISTKVKATPTPCLNPDPNPLRQGVFHECVPEVLSSAVDINPVARALLVNREMWPNDWRLRSPVGRDGTINLSERVLAKTRPLPCAVAKYSRPDLIDPTLLKERGLLMKVVHDPDSNTQRWLSPCEIQAALGFPWGLMLTKDFSKTFHMLGNAISPIHAALTISRLAIIYPQAIKHSNDIFRAIMQIVAQTPKVNKAFVDYDDEYFWILPLVNPESPLVLTDEQSIEMGLRDAQTQTCKDCDAKKRRYESFEPVADDTHVFPCEHVSGEDERLVGVSGTQNVKPCPEPINLTHVITIDSDMIFDCAHTYGFHAAFECERIVYHLDKDTWITGQFARTAPFRCEVVNPDRSPLREVCVLDFHGTWTCHIHVGVDTCIGEVMMKLFPFIDPSHCEFVLDEIYYASWTSPLIGANLTVKFRKTKRIIHVAGTPNVISCFCDPIDTVASFVDENPWILKTGIPRMVALLQLGSSTVCGLSSVCTLEPGDSLLKLRQTVWTLVFEEAAVHLVLPDEITFTDEEHECITVSSQATVIDEPSATVSGLDDESVIGVIHPITGRFHEVRFSQDKIVAQLLDLIQPEVPATNCLAPEINGKRISLLDRVCSFPSTSTIRFRFYGGVGGAPSCGKDCLKTELVSRGVPVEQVNHRIAAVMNTVGERMVDDIFQTEDPWSRLKETCTAKKVRLVMPGELKAHQTSKRSASIPERSNSSASSAKGSSKGRGKGKGKQDKPRPIPLPEWCDVDLPDGFVNSEDLPIDYIQITELQRDAQGVCPLTIQETEPYISTAVRMSADPLAIIVPGHHFEQSEDHISHISFPVTVKATGAPILIPATLVQLGQENVFFSFQGPSASVETVESTVLEVQVCSDYCPVWKSSSKPLDILAQCIPALRDRDVLISHWSWKWTKERKVAPPAMSTHIHGYIRVTDSSLDKLLSHSGPQGVSLWPKATNKQLDARYSHIVIDARGPDEASAVTKATNNAIGFVQGVNGKWLVRCKREHYPDTRRVLIPDGLILENASVGEHDAQFVLQSCTTDLSCTTQAINVGLQELGWEAKVVKTLGPAAWLLTSKTNPPGPHLSLNNLIMAVKPHDGTRGVDRFSTFVPRSSPKLDSATSSNPWSHYVPLSSRDAAPQTGPGPTANRFAELEKAIEQKFEKRLVSIEGKMERVTQASAASNEACMNRLTQIETTVSNTQVHLDSFEQKIASNHQQMLLQMKGLFQQHTPIVEEACKRPRKSDPKPDHAL